MLRDLKMGRLRSIPFSYFLILLMQGWIPQRRKWPEPGTPGGDGGRLIGDQCFFPEDSTPPLGAPYFLSSPVEAGDGAHPTGAWRVCSCRGVAGNRRLCWPAQRWRWLPAHHSLDPQMTARRQGGRMAEIREQNWERISGTTLALALVPSSSPFPSTLKVTWFGNKPKTFLWCCCPSRCHTGSHAYTGLPPVSCDSSISLLTILFESLETWFLSLLPFIW